MKQSVSSHNYIDTTVKEQIKIYKAKSIIGSSGKNHLAESNKMCSLLAI